MDITLFVSGAFANYATSGIEFDAMVTGLAVIVFILHEGRRLGMERLWLPIAAIFAVGLFLGLPLFLLMMEDLIASTDQ